MNFEHFLWFNCTTLAAALVLAIGIIKQAKHIRKNTEAISNLLDQILHLAASKTPVDLEFKRKVS